MYVPLFNIKYTCMKKPKIICKLASILRFVCVCKYCQQFIYCENYYL